MNVFKKSVFWLLLFVGSYSCFAQEISIRGGLNLSQMQIKWDERDGIESTRIKPGFQLGPIIEFPVNRMFSFETGLLYSTKGFKQIGELRPDVSRNSWKLDIAYVVVPVGIKASFPFRNVIVSGLGGGYIASGLFGDLLFLEDINDKHGTWLKVEWGDQNEEINRLDYGLNFGISIKYKKAQFGAYYELGLADLVVQDPSTRKNLNRSLQLCVTYNLWKNLKQRK